ncbi:hypothetical protein Y032_0108g13 [Ancylostoma ceylanicum]|uniref:Uncharacterized protein n=1 Tax=Ancylostoma ceylanicum TaxID=53326 RepID=A0A016TF72_9BILA|nr:hypothetical protein Y032_0108g13 [Ancylostoma ceylanicum]
MARTKNIGKAKGNVNRRDDESMTREPLAERHENPVLVNGSQRQIILCCCIVYETQDTQVSVRCQRQYGLGELGNRRISTSCHENTLTGIGSSGCDDRTDDRRSCAEGSLDNNVWTCLLAASDSLGMVGSIWPILSNRLP